MRRISYGILRLDNSGYYRRWPDWSSCFYLESFAYLIGPVTANHNVGSNSARSHIANRQKAWLYLNQSACSGAITASVVIGCDRPNMQKTQDKSSYFNLVTFDNTLSLAYKHTSETWCEFDRVHYSGQRKTWLLKVTNSTVTEMCKLFALNVFALNFKCHNWRSSQFSKIWSQVWTDPLRI